MESDWVFSATFFINQGKIPELAGQASFSCRTLISLTCPHQHRPNHWVHTLARAPSSCQHASSTAVTDMGVIWPCSLHPKSIFPQKLEGALPMLAVGCSITTTPGAPGARTDTTAASSSSSHHHHMHLPCLGAKQPCLQSLGARKLFRGFK